MRISVTGRCNLHCLYCMPPGMTETDSGTEERLSYEQLQEIAESAAGLGISCFRITGGEPLLRDHLSVFVRMLKETRGVKRVTLTTNALLLSDYLPDLLDAGLDSVNVSLDSLRPDTYKKMTGTDGLSRVRAGLSAAADAGLPVKVNAVLIPGVNDGDWEDLLSIAGEKPVDVRFIERMPVEGTAGYAVVDGSSVLDKIRTVYPDITVDAGRKDRHAGPAVYYRIPGFCGRIGFINAISGKFCADCSRIRVTCTGDICPCLCSEMRIPSAGIFRQHPGRGERNLRQHLLQDCIRTAIFRKPAGHHMDAAANGSVIVRMPQIGG